MRLLIVLSALLIPCLAQLSEDSSELEFGGQQAQRPSPDGPLFPRFLMHVPRFARKEFFDIVSNDQLSQDQQNEQLTIWAKAFNVTDEFNAWTKKIQEQKEAVSKNVEAVASNITTVYTQLEEILSNSNLTRRDQHDQIRKLATTFPREVRALFFIARNYRPEGRSPIFGQGIGMGKKPQSSMVPFIFQQQQPPMMMFGQQPFMPAGPMMMNRFQQTGSQQNFQSRRGGRGDGPGFVPGTQDNNQRGSGERGQRQNFGPSDNLTNGNQFSKKQFARGPSSMNSDLSENSQHSDSNSQFDFPRGPGGRGGRGQGPDFGPGGQGGRGQGPDFGPQDDFPGRRGSGGPGGRGGRGQGPDFEPQDDFPGRRGSGGPGGRGGRGQEPDFGPGGQGGRGQGPDFGPQDDFPGRRGSGGPEGRDGRGQGPDFGPGSQGGRGQDSDSGSQDAFPGRRGSGGPGGRGQGPDFGPQDDFPGRRGSGGQGDRGQGPDFGARSQGNRGQGPAFESRQPRQFDDADTSSAPSQKYFQRQMNSGMRFDQSSGFGMRKSQSTQQNYENFAEN